MLQLLNISICLLMAFTLLCFRRQGAAYRPFASLLAYLLLLSTTSIALLQLLGLPEHSKLPQLFINLVLLLALLAQRGNVAEVFRNSSRESRLANWLRKEKWI
ncbi:phage holin family protein [Aquitalea sp. ASV11]|uniref:phage holin family protein n=1 Tax=Aquitalea sp. ASV11 TaxID=2795103 RepID=UPI0018EC9771|nr:phage holin family protein [Aquitalea sp. ASV11]